MIKSYREIVLPGHLIGEEKNLKPGKGTISEKGKIYASILGILHENPPYVEVVPIKGRYIAIVNDLVIGVIEEAMSSSWLVDINAPYPALLHVTEVPWEVDFGETEKFLNTGDSIMAKVLRVDLDNKLNVTMKDRNLYKIRGGYIMNVEPSKVPRIIGKKYSMIDLLKKYTRCRIFVGKNGRIWIDGDDENVAIAQQAIQMIEEESLSFGLTNKIEEFLTSHSQIKEV